MAQLSPLRTAFVHVGTHKTGTTSIQALLGMNDAALHAAGVLIPRTARAAEQFGAHHNIAWELLGDGQFDPARGTVDALLDELSASTVPHVCISSEEFEFLYLSPPAMQRLREALRECGYVATIVLYLRPQADYIESLYAEISRRWDVSFNTFFEAILRDGIYGRTRFDYAAVTAAFAGVFGRENLIVRAYRSSATSEALLREFAGTIVSRPLDIRTLDMPARLNRMACFPDVVAMRERLLDCSVPHRISPEQPFDPLDAFDLIRIALRFAGGNAALRRDYGVDVGCVTPATLVRECCNVLFHDPESRYRKWLIRSLEESYLDAAA